MKPYLSTFALAAFAPLLLGQGTSLGTIRGYVLDTSGKGIGLAAVSIVDQTTGAERTLQTAADGYYEATGLPLGRFLISVTATGFDTLRQREVRLQTADIVRADATLSPSGRTDSVTVSTPQSERAGIGTALDSTQLLSLPRDSRDVYSFLYLSPNVTQGASPGLFKYVGAQSYGASFNVDTQRSNGGIFGEPTASQPSLEATSEVVVLSRYNAEYAGIAHIRVETRRGGNQMHGSLFHNNRNSALAAWDLRDKVAQAQFLPTPARASFAKPYFNQNEFGGSLGGPVAKKAFFFSAYERQILNTPVRFQSTTLPGPRLWTGDFSQLVDNRKPLVPAGTGLTPAEIAANTVGGRGERFISIPQRLLNPVTGALIRQYFPAVNPEQPVNAQTGQLLDYFESQPGTLRRDLGTLRLDFPLNERHMAYASLNISNQDSATLAVVNPFTGLGLTQNERRNYTLATSYVWQIRPNLVNEFRGGFNQQDLFRRSNQTLRQFLTGIGFTESDIAAYGAVTGPDTLDTFGHPAISFGTGFAALGNGGRNTFRPQDQNLLTFGDTLSWWRGRHNWKFGGDIVYNAAVDGFANNRGSPRGQITYGGAGPDAFARFLMGRAPDRVTYVHRLRPPMDVSNWEHGFFAQDDFRVSPSVTLNLGLRYEISTPFTEKNDVLANFDPDFVSTAGRRGRFVIPSERTLPYLDPRIVSFGYVVAAQAGLPRSLVRRDWSKVAPRLGVTWRAAGNFIIRAGYGRYFPTSAAQGMRDAMASNPFNQARTKTGATVPLSPWPGGGVTGSPLSGGALSAIGSTPAVGAIPFGLREPRIHQFQASLERRWGGTLVRASYLGTRMRGLINGRDLNMIPPSDVPFGTTTGDGVTACNPSNFDCTYSPADLARQPFPGLGDFLASYGNFGRGTSNAGQLESTYQSSRMSFGASYTLLDQKSTAVDAGSSSLGGLAYNVFNPEADFGRDSFVSRHRLVGYGFYQLPKRLGVANSWLSSALGSWRIGWQGFVKSGTGFTPYWYCNNCGPAAPGNIGSTFLDALGDFSGNSYRPLIVGDWSGAGDQIWRPQAFAPPTVSGDALDHSGVAKRNVLTGPSAAGLNLGVQRLIAVGERWRAEVGADFNNVLNHPLFLPDQVGGDAMSLLGSFSIAVDPSTRRLRPITDVLPNPDFGRRTTAYPQEGIDPRRVVRLKLRLEF